MSASVFAPLPLSAPSNQPLSATIFFGGAQHVDASFGACVSVNNDDDIDVDVVRFLRDGGMDANGPRLSVVFVVAVVVVLVFVISRLDYFTFKPTKTTFTAPAAVDEPRRVARLFNRTMVLSRKGRLPFYPSIYASTYRCACQGMRTQRTNERRTNERRRATL